MTEDPEAMLDRLPEPSPLATGLITLVRAEDRTQSAAEQGLQYENGRVKVEIELVAGGDLPDASVAEVLNRQGNLVIAWVAVGDLVTVALDEDVRIVRGSATPQTHGTAGG